jgi:hypothetical protein
VNEQVGLGPGGRGSVCMYAEGVGYHDAIFICLTGPVCSLNA